MAQQRPYQTIRIWQQTLKTLRFIRAHTGESIVAILDRLATAEWERFAREKTSHGEPQESGQTH